MDIDRLLLCVDCSKVPVADLSCELADLDRDRELLLEDTYWVL
jgi:hypothetical protein